ncbi:Acyl-CoA-binding domain-containing protein 4 [Hibiscus syriacus]|uniref:Acyl-CoA-binding domain-containing protein 4 n=1 Tax=Hibiscus syriacus TaxID=106335 RepID=A0A6A3CI64_HIBSY|nr:Acyl-CoA-binding domain-containing protein 4 [Hibiscus syriacus]
MARAISGLAYPDRFYAAAAYAGFGGSPNSSNQDMASSWQQLGNMVSAEAMRLFVKILEEEEPGWFSRASNSGLEPVTDHNSSVEPIIENGNSFAETTEITVESEGLMETQDKDVLSEGLGSVVVYDQWISPPITGQRPKGRFEHAAAVVEDKMYIHGGNHNGHYLSDLHVLDLRSCTWSKVEDKIGSKSVEPPSTINITPCAGHSLVPWENKLLSIAGHTKDPSETIQDTLKNFDLQSGMWSMLKTYVKAPDSDPKLLHMLEFFVFGYTDIGHAAYLGVPPSLRSGHAAALRAERYLLIFGGGSHATCFNDLHVLDLQTMEWSRPTQGKIPVPRAGHAGVTVGENQFIVGGGDNKSGASETVVLNMSTLAWSVVTSVEGHVPLASEGLSLVVGSLNGEDILISFGGYNGRYNSEPSHKSTLQSKIMEGPAPDSVSTVHYATNLTKDLESEFEVGQEGKYEKLLWIVLSPWYKFKGEGASEHILAMLKAEKEELESSLHNEQFLSVRLRQELADAKAQTDLYKEFQSLRGQLASEQTRCFKLEVDVAQLRQKVQTMETLQRELELLQRKKITSEQAALNSKQRRGSGGLWGWLAGSSPENED